MVVPVGIYLLRRVEHVGWGGWGKLCKKSQAAAITANQVYMSAQCCAVL